MKTTPLDNHHGISHLGGVHKRDALYSARREPQKLNVRKKVRFASSLAAASLEGLFEHPARISFHHPKQSTGIVSVTSKIVFQ